MKTILCLFAAALFCKTTFASPLRFPERGFYNVGPVTVDLTPLFKWWGSAAAKNWTNGMVRPLPRWLRITGTNFWTSGQGWIVAATVEYAPGHATNLLIYLKHPPAQDRLNFFWAVKNVDAMQEQYRMDSEEMEDYYREENKAHGQAEAIDNVRNSSSSLDQEMKISGQMANSDASFATRERQKAQEKTRLELNTLNTMTTLLAQFETRKFYRLDFFALDTGFKSNGLPVLDLGELPPGS